MLQTISITSLIIIFIHATTWEGMLFEFVNEMFEDAPSWIRKPIFDCPTCMAPWWSLIILFFMGYEIVSYKDLVIIICSVGGLNTIIDCAFLNKIKE
jgi:hypothetical protein